MADLRLNKTFCRIFSSVLTVLILASAVMALPLTAMASASAPDGASEPTSANYDGAVSATLDKNGRTVRVEIQLSEQFLTDHKKETLYIFALPYGTQSLAGLSPVTDFRATDRYIYKTELTRGRLSGIHNGYCLAKATGDGYDSVGSIVYITDFSHAADRDYDYPAVSSLKGLEVTNVGDALALNLSHAVVRADISSLLLARGGADSTDCDFNGRTCHISTAALAALDDKVRALSHQGVRVYLRLMPGEAYDSAAGLCRLMERRADEVAGLISLLADRYTDPASPYGFCGSVIVGREVNLPAAEEGVSMTPTEYISAYVRLCRMVYAGFTSVYSNAQVYIAPSNNFSLVPEGYDTAATSINDFLSTFDLLTRRGGNYCWGVAASAYAYSRDDSSIWDDALANGASSQLISPANIQVLTALMTKNYNFEGERRPSIIGAFSAPDTDSAAAQATSLAYAYYKVLATGGVDALIWGAQTDAAEGAFSRHGLSRADLSGNILEKKSAWKIMSLIDTKSADTLLSTLLGIGEGGVVDYVHSTQAAAAQVKSCYSGSGEPLTTHEGLKLSPMFDFTDGERHGFELSGQGYLSLPALVSYNNGSALQLTSGATLVNYSVPRGELSGQHCVAVTLGQCAGGGRLVLSLSQGDMRRYTAEARFESGCNEIIFDTKAFCKGLDRANVAFSLTLYPDNGEGAYSITGISVAKDTTAAPVMWVIIFVVLVAIAVVVVLSVFTGSFHAVRRKMAAARRSRGELTTTDGNSRDEAERGDDR